MAPEHTDRGWDRGWEEHKARQLQRLAQLPFSEKLAWLEAAQALAAALTPPAGEPADRAASGNVRYPL